MTKVRPLILDIDQPKHEDIEQLRLDLVSRMKNYDTQLKGKAKART